MWQFEYSEVTPASEAKIWNLWAAVQNWPTWDTALTSAKINGEFKVGSTIELQLPHLPAIKASITRCDLHKGFVMVSRLPFAKLIYSHEIFEQADLHKITHQLTCKGMLAFFWGRILARKIAQHLPSTVHNLVKTAEQLTAPSPF